MDIVQLGSLRSLSKFDTACILVSKAGSFGSCEGWLIKLGDSPWIEVKALDGGDKLGVDWTGNILDYIIELLLTLGLIYCQVTRTRQGATIGRALSIGTLLCT